MPLVFSKYNDIPKHVADFFEEHTNPQPALTEMLEKIDEGISLEDDEAIARFEQELGISGIGM
jgi:hypothetical protein